MNFFLYLIYSSIILELSKMMVVLHCLERMH